MEGAEFRLCLLGRLEIDAADGTVVSPPLPGRRAELVFAYLAAEHHRIVTRDELADALWPVELPAAWAAALRGVVSEVRQFLAASGLDPDEILATTRGGYALRLPGGVTTDLDTVRTAVVKAEADLAADEPVPAARRATEAATLAHLPFIPNHDCAWADDIRRELDALRVRALDLATRAWSAVGDSRAAAAAAEQLVRADPFNESAHQLRIRILGEVGDRAGALVAYQYCSDVLARELGTEPSAETEATLQRALAGYPHSEPEARRQATDLADYSVLVVEDHDFQRRTVSRLLRGIGVAEVREAVDGGDALAVLDRSPPPDVILCDVDMPGMDGVEFVRRVAELGLASAVVITSALDARVLRAVETVTAGYGLTVLGAIEKPISARRLREVLEGYSRRDRPATLTDGVDVAELRQVIEAGELPTAFEPIIDLATGRASGAVAVPVGPHGDPVASTVLAPLLVSPSISTAFVDSTLRSACGAVAAWRAGGLALETVLELPPSAVSDVALADRAAAIVSHDALESQLFTWALTEAPLRRDPTVALDVLTRLRLKGFGLALTIDDATTPSTERLDELPVTVIRLDHLLVAGAAKSPRRIAALQAARDAAATFNVPVVAAGCDTRDDFDAVLALGCDYAYGSFVADAMPAADVRGWAMAWQDRDAAGHALS